MTHPKNPSPSIVTIIKTTQLTPWQIDQLQALCEISAELDGFATHFYWDSLSHRQTECITDFLLYLNDELIAAVSLFLFEDDSIEICALTHPNHRKNGYFYRLFSEAQIEIFSLNIQHCIFCCPKKSSSARRFLKHMQAAYQSSDRHLVIRPENFKPASSQKIKLKKASAEDAKILAELSAKCFDSDRTLELERILEILPDKQRIVFMGLFENTLMGKIHCIKSIKSKHQISLHDFCVHPDFQKQGLAGEFLSKILTHFFRYQNSHVHIHASSHHHAALKLYKHLGFEELETIEYWQLNLFSNSNFNNPTGFNLNPVIH